MDISKYRTKNWVEIDDDSCGTYNTNIQIKFKTAMFKASLCNYNNPYILVKGTSSVANMTARAVTINNHKKKLMFKKLCPIYWLDKRNKLDNAKHIDIEISMYNLKEYSDNDSKTSGTLWKCYRDKQRLNNLGVIVDFVDNNIYALFKFRENVTYKTCNNGTKMFN